MTSIAAGARAATPKGAAASVRAPWWLLAGLAGLVVAFELVPRLGIVPGGYLHPLSEALGALGRWAADGRLWAAIAATAQAWVIGFAVATLVGMAAGVLIGSVPVLRTLTASTIDLLRTVPAVVFIPLVFLLFGAGMGSSLFLIGWSVFWLVLIQVLYGMADVDPVALDTARSLGLGRLATVRHVVVPSLLPYVITGLRLAVSAALILAVASGLLLGAPGLGRDIWLATSGGDYPLMWGLILVTGVLGVAVSGAVWWLERRVIHWHTAVRSERGAS